MSRTLDDCPLADVIYSYDELGRLLTKTTGGGTLSEAYSYDIHSWKTGSTALVNGQTVFTQSLRYNAPLTGGHAGLYNGNISEGSVWYAGQDGSTVNTAYSYDGLNRLTDAARPDRTERSILYDRNGNITGLTRYAESGTPSETISFSHDGNRLSSVSASAAYQYDSAGNLTYDPRKGLHFCYNVANLPSSVRRDGEDSSLITYRYLSDGTKLSAEAVLQPEIDEGDGYTPARIYRRRYKGSFTYVTDPDTGEEKLESIVWKEGMIFLRRMAETSESMDTLAVPDAGNHIIYDRWYVKDHLGNVRTVVELGSHVGEIVEQDDYLPFGTRFIPATQGVVCTADTGLYGSEHDNRYRYAGKEEQRFGPQIDLALLDFGARAYDPFTARWTSVDPLSHKYLGFSPYNYCGNNPVMYFDPDGEKIYGNDGKYISYNNSKGWSSNTPKEFISFASNFMQYREGRRIMNQMLHSNVEYTVNFSSSYLPNEKTHKIDKRVMGNNAVFHDETTDEIKKSYITLSQPAISGRQEFKDLSDAQFTAGIFAHEYGHSTPPNHSLKTIEEKENHANTFRNMIFSEISIKTPLPKISWTIKPSIQ